MIQIIIVMY